MFNRKCLDHEKLDQIQLKYNTFNANSSLRVYLEDDYTNCHFVQLNEMPKIRDALYSITRFEYNDVTWRC